MKSFRVATTVFAITMFSACLGLVGTGGASLDAGAGGGVTGGGGGAGGGGSDAGISGDAGQPDGGNPDAGVMADGGTVTCENTTGVPAELQVINRFTSRTLSVLWENPDCVDEVGTTLTPQTYHGFTTNSNDHWKVTDAATGEVLYDGRLGTGRTTLIFPVNDAQVCSQISDVASTVTFRNRYLARALSLYWVDPACKEVPAGELPSRESINVNTFTGHVFRFRQAGTGELVLSVPPLALATKYAFAPDDATAPVCSDVAIDAATVTFQNRYPSRTVALYWVDYKCNEVKITDLAPNSPDYPVNTFSTHVFLFRDSTTNELLKSPPAVSSAAQTISVP